MLNCRVCQVIGHQDYEVTHICSFKGCDSNILLCSVCIQSDIHLHGQQKQQHIISFIQFKGLCGQMSGCISEYNAQREKIMKSCKSILELLQTHVMRKLVEQKDFKDQLYIISKVNKSDFIEIDKEPIQQILYLQDEINLSKRVWTQMKEQYLQLFNNLSNSLQIDNGNKIKEQQAQIKQVKTKKLKQHDIPPKYMIFYKQDSKMVINAAMISPNENWLAQNAIKFGTKI